MNFVTSPNDQIDTNEANLTRVWKDSLLQKGIELVLAGWIHNEPRQCVSVIQLDMDKSVEIRKCGISYKLRILSEVAELLKEYNSERCIVIPHGTRDDITILRKCWSIQEETDFAMRLLERLHKTPFGHSMDCGPFRISYSAGVALYPFHGKTERQLLELADGAVRWAKDHGRNRWALAETGYHYLQSGEVDGVRWERLLALSIETGVTVEELVREGYETLFQKHAAFYRFCDQETREEDT